MTERKFIFPVVILILVLIGFSLWSYRTPNLQKLVVECSEILRKEKRPTKPYIICCVKGRELEICTDRNVFHPGETVIVDVSLNPLNRYFDPYYVCGYTELLSVSEDIEFPKQITIEEIKDGKHISCSKMFTRNVYHHFLAYGTIPEKERVELLSVRIFPEWNYSTLKDFERMMDLSVLALNLTKVVE